MSRPLSPQAQFIWDYLRSGKELTPMVAFNAYGVSSVTTRISEIRRNDGVKEWLQAQGKEISAVWSEDHLNKRYRKYGLVDVKKETVA